MDNGQIEALVDEVFRRISSGGELSVEDLFTPDGIYEGAYADEYIDGAKAIAAMLGKAIPQVISPFRQWPIGVIVNANCTAAAVEYMSEGTAVHDGSSYRNLYTGVMRFRDGKIAYWREYYDPARFAAAVGPPFVEIVAREMPPGSMPAKTGHRAVIEM